MIETHHYTFVKPTEFIAQRVDHNVNYDYCNYYVSMSYVKHNKYTILLGDNDNGRGYACVGIGNTWEISVFSPQFCCKQSYNFLKRQSMQSKRYSQYMYPIKNS